MDDRDVVRLLGVARAAVGVIWLLAPHKPIKAWTGEDPTSVAARVVGRGFGGRDLALAVGTLLTLKDERALATWLKARALSDAAGSVRRLFWAATAAGTAALGLRLAGAVDQLRPYGRATPSPFPRRVGRYVARGHGNAFLGQSGGTCKNASLGP
jgi:hypothetical protein